MSSMWRMLLALREYQKGLSINCSVLSKYYQDEDRLLIIKCVDLMVSKARREQGYISIDD
jgi:hypothetical protein